MSHSRNQLQEETTNQLQELFLNLQNLQQQFAAFQTSQVSQSPLPSFQFQPQQIVSIPTQPIQQNFEEIQELFKTDLTQPDVPTNSGIIPETISQFTNQEQEQEISDVPSDTTNSGAPEVSNTQKRKASLIKNIPIPIKRHCGLGKSGKDLELYKKECYPNSPKENQDESDSEQSIDFAADEISEVSNPTFETKVHFSDELPTTVPNSNFETKPNFSNKLSAAVEPPTAVVEPPTAVVEPPLQAPEPEPIEILFEETLIESDTPKKNIETQQEDHQEAALLIQREVTKELNKVPTLCNCISNKKQLIDEIVTKVSNRVINDFSDTHKLDKSQRKRSISLKTFIADEWENFQISHLKHLELTKQILIQLDFLVKKFGGV